ncbi:MAG: fimbrial protein FimV, partial [Xanthomonadaceae bacterium]|nr:fimbrial protein FimV [Xanthomonadaceae bacterium]
EAKPAAAATAETVVAKAGQAKPAAAAPAPAASAPASSATAAKPAAAPAGAATAPVANPVASPAKAEPAKTAPVKPAAIKPAPVSEEPWYTQLWVQALGGAVVLLLLLGWLLGRRKAKPAALPKSAPSLADRFGGELPMDDTHDDVDQNLLLDQLAEHPDDVGLHLELVSLYYGRRDIEHFEAAAEAMHAHVTDPQQEEWQQVVRMGEDLVPAHPLFADHGSMVADEHEARHGFDIDQYAAEPPAPSAPPPMPASPVTVSEYNFNFDLTPSHERHAEDAKPAAQPVVDEDATVIRGSEAKPDWHFDEEPETQLQPAGHDIEPREFSDDPVDTKLDLARAYLDMGDPEGARAMLEEVLHEGSQVQRDVAKRLLDDLH